MRRFLGLPVNAEPRGEGKTKLRSPYKTVDVTGPYKAGERAHDLIYCPSIEAIEEGAPMNIKALRQVVFGTD